MNTFSRRFSWMVLGLLTISLLVNPIRSYAQEPTPSDDEINAIAKDLYCPVCENIPLDACRTEACEQWRGVIRDKLKQGWSEEKIKGYFVEQYGDRVLAEPPREGFNWLVYVVPPLALLAGAYLLYRGFKMWQVTDGTAPDVGESRGPAVEDEYLSRVEEELRNR